MDMKRFLMVVVTVFFAIVFVLDASACQSVSDVRVPILVYHNIVDPGVDGGYDAKLNISAGLFESHMRAIKDAGYNTISFEQYHSWLQGGASLPPKPIIISFDDGYYSNYRYAYPVLKKLGMKATIFVIADRRGEALSEYPHFSWSQAREMYDSGYIDIQSHTYSHRDLTVLDKTELELELHASKHMIESRLGRRCSVVSYPFGAVNDEVIEAARGAGYKLACKVGDEGANGLEDDPYALKRITANGNWTGRRLIEVIDKNTKAK